MKKMCCFLIMLLCLSLAGCLLDPSKPYSYSQEINQIDKISILLQSKEYSNWEERFSVITELDQSQYTGFLRKLSSIKGQPFINPPSVDFGLYVVCITYKNGEEEYISCNNNAYLLPGKTIRYDTYWFSDKDGFAQLIEEYIGYAAEEFQ